MKGTQKRHRTGIDSPQLVGFHMDMGVETYLQDLTHTQVSPLGPELYTPNLARSLTSLCRLPQSVWTLSISPSPPSHRLSLPPSRSASHLYLLLGEFHQKFICCQIFIFRNVTITFETCVGTKENNPLTKSEELLWFFKSPTFGQISASLPWPASNPPFITSGAFPSHWPAKDF